MNFARNTSFRKTILPVLCVLASLPAYAQSKTDSLERLIRASHSDTERVKLQLSRAEAFSEINLDSSIDQSRQVVTAASRLGMKKVLARARMTLSADFCFKAEYDSARHQLSEGLTVAKEENNLSLQGGIFNGYGMLYGMQGKYDSSCDYFLEAIRLNELAKDTTQLSLAYRNLASSYQMLSRFAEASRYAQMALKLAELKHNLNQQAYITMNLGTIYSAIGDNGRAEEYLLKCIRLARERKLVNVELYSTSNLAGLYVGIKRTSEAYEMALRARALAKQIGDPGMEATTTGYMAVAAEGLEHPVQADSLGRQAIELAIKSKQPLNMFQTEYDYADMLARRKKYDESILHYQRAFAAMKSSDLFDNQFSKAYRAMSDAYEKSGRFREALTAFQSAIKIQDSVVSKENVRKTTENSMNAEFEKKEQARALERERENQAAKNRQRLLIIGLVVTVLVAGGAWYAFSMKRKANLLLENQKKALQSALSDLKATQAQLIEAEKMASLGELTAGIAHEIQNPLNFVNNFSEVSVELIDELKTAIATGNQVETAELSTDLAGNLEKIIYHGKRADTIVKSMLQHSRRSSDQKELTDLNQLADEYLRLSYHGLRAKNKSFNATLNTDFDPGLGKTAVIPQDIGRVLLNLLTNAFYAVAEKQQKETAGYVPSVWISTRKTGQLVTISVRDNGEGIPDKVREKMFQPFFTTKPTGQGTGLGLSLSYDIVKAHGGEITVDSSPGEGTEFIVRLPAQPEPAAVNTKSEQPSVINM